MCKLYSIDIPQNIEVQETVSSVTFLDIDLIFDNNGPISTRFYNKEADINLGNIHFQQLDRNILASRPYGAYISQSSLQFVFRVFTTSRNLSTKLWNQGLFLRKVFFPDYINTLLSSMLSVGYRWRTIEWAIKIRFKVNNCFPIMSSDGLLYYHILKLYVKPLSFYTYAFQY